MTFYYITCLALDCVGSFFCEINLYFVDDNYTSSESNWNGNIFSFSFSFFHSQILFDLASSEGEV